MIDREFDLKDIENSIEKVYASGAVENQTRALEVLKAETYELDSKCRASLVKYEPLKLKRFSRSFFIVVYNILTDFFNGVQ